MIPMSRFSKTLLLLGSSLTLLACSEAPAPVSGQQDTEADILVDTEFNPNLLNYISTLASDEFQGRAPATKGEELTVAYLEDHFRKIGLKPIDGDSYKQPVSLVQIDPKEVSPLYLKGDKVPDSFSYRDEMMAWTMRVVEESSISDSDIIFVGYGVVAPEYNWDDYAGVDVTGKTVVMFVNDPGFATKDPALFNGNAMTYYGRWTYKFEEAARQGAAAALIIHETDAAAYGWNVVAHGSPTKFDLINENKNMDLTAIQGWITTESAQKLFANIDSDIESMRQFALSNEFQAVPLNVKASVSVKNNLRELTSSNVIGYIEGSTYPDEYILYMAHWDHLGMDFSDPNDKVFNGAQDNATGTGGLMAIAENFMQQPQPERSIIFAAVAAEERGLLGSKWYAENPVFPLEKTAAGINMDVLNVYGPMRDVVIVGYGNSDLDDLLAKYAEKQHRYAAPEPTPENGFYYRSDHFSLAKVGVPMIYAGGGIDSFEHGKEWGLQQNANYVTCCYHKITDEVTDDWDIRGMQQDLALYFNIGNEVANSRLWPNWREGNEFRAIRDTSADSRKE